MKAWEKNIRKVVPYVPGEQPQLEKMIKLNTNENPYPPSPKVMETRDKIENLRLYPDPMVSKLVNAIAGYHGLEPEQVFVGVGSDDVLAMAFLTFFNSEKPILFPDITYSFYDVWAELYKIPYKQPELDENFRIRKEDYMEENGGVIFPNPNAPTGVYENLDFIESILKANQDVIVIIDEAYIDFGGTSALELLPKYENLLVVRTFSKSRSMAGMRIGYAMGNKELIQALNVVKHSYNSYTMNQPSICMGVASIEDEEYFKDKVEKIIATREQFKKDLAELGFSFPDSKSNFVFATHKTAKAKDIFEAAKKEGIFLRYFNQPKIDNYLRISIGTEEEMKALVAFFKSYLNQ
ncbi:MAG: histidinol-phosphate transaminase [Lachnospiraceae bacterium]|nr:histidinol-phosphate transaminase [Lachnospiraceae bacterium]